MATPVSRDPKLEAHVFWYRFRAEIAAVAVFAFLVGIGYAGYRFYSERQNSAAAVLMGSAKRAQDYEQVIAHYPSTAAGASAFLFLAEVQRNDRKFAESNATLQLFIDKHPGHELVSTARIAMAANLQTMGKTDEALSIYQQVAVTYPQGYVAPLALISQVSILKAKNQSDAARRVCETIITQYRESFWANEAMRELRSLKPSESVSTAAPSVTTPGLAPPSLLERPARQPLPAPAPSGAPAAPKPSSAAKPK
jgi:TolA-binding protein